MSTVTSGGATAKTSKATVTLTTKGSITTTTTNGAFTGTTATSGGFTTTTITPGGPITGTTATQTSPTAKSTATTIKTTSNSNSTRILPPAGGARVSPSSKSANASMASTVTTPPVSLSSLLTTQNTTIVGNYSTTPGIPQCPPPKPIIGGAIISTGPYLANFTKAVYTCFTGYSLNGPASMLCSPEAKWKLDPPQCVPVNSHPKVDNHISVTDNIESVPGWLLYVMAAMFGLVCLLLLTCILLYCLKICGCLRGSRFGNKVSAQEKVHRQPTSIYVVDDFDRKTYKSPAKSAPRPPEQQNGRRVIVKPEACRREAAPLTNKWMPHRHQVRKNNSSTK